jgi:hypothetical protein
MKSAKGIHTLVKVKVIPTTTVHKHMTAMEAPCRLTARAAVQKNEKMKN